MAGLKGLKVALNRKILADMAIHDPAGFNQLAEMVKKKAS
jgi:ribosomal protein L20